MQAYISIGRNRGGLPMSARDWRDFRREVERALEDVGVDTIYTRALGVGEWTDDDGNVVRERCYVIVGELPSTRNPVSRLREELAKLARRYGQDAIALAVVETEFVTAAE